MEACGEITFDGITESRGIHRFSEKRMERWLLSHLHGQSGDSPARYDVTFLRVGAGHIVHCSVRVQSGDRLWTASGYGNGAQQALNTCLESMMERSLRPSLPQAPGMIVPLTGYV